MFIGRTVVCSGSSLARNVLFQRKVQFFVPVSQFSSKSSSNAEFKQIYRMPFIAAGSALNKVKKLQLFGAGLAVPGAFIANSLNLCDMEMASTISFVGLTSTAGVFLVGQIFCNMIGFVYVSKDLQTVRFSYSDFWGKRQDVDFPREELIPLTNSATYPTDFLYRKVYRYSVTEPYKLSLKGDIVNTEAFKYIFKHNPD